MSDWLPEDIPELPQEGLGAYETMRRTLNNFRTQSATNSVIEKFVVLPLLEHREKKERARYEDQGFSFEEELISPEEAKASFDLDVKEPMTKYQLALRSALKKEKLQAEAEFEELEGVSYAAGTLASMVMFALDPVALSLDVAIGSALGPAGIAARLGGRISKAIPALNRIGKFGKRMKSTGAVRRIGMSTQKARQVMGKMGRKLGRPSTRRFLRAAAIGGSASGLEELIRGQVEASKGYSYDYAPYVAMGVFGPAVLRGAGSAIAATYKKGSKIVNKGVTKSKVGKALAGDAKALDEVKMAENAKVNSAVSEIPANKPINTGDFEADVSPGPMKDAISYLERNIPGTIHHISKIAESLQELGVQVNLEKMFPFLRNTDEVLKRMNEVATKKYGKADLARLRHEGLDDIFEVKNSDLERYIKEEAIIPDRTPQKVEPSPPTKGAGEALQALADSKGAGQEIARGGLEVQKAIKAFTNCLKNGPPKVGGE